MNKKSYKLRKRQKNEREKNETKKDLTLRKQTLPTLEKLLKLYRKKTIIENNRNATENAKTTDNVKENKETTDTTEIKEKQHYRNYKN